MFSQATFNVSQIFEILGAAQGAVSAPGPAAGPALIPPIAPFGLAPALAPFGMAPAVPSLSTWNTMALWAQMMQQPTIFAVPVAPTTAPMFPTPSTSRPSTGAWSIPATPGTNVAGNLDFSQSTIGKQVEPEASTFKVVQNRTMKTREFLPHLNVEKLIEPENLISEEDLHEVMTLYGAMSLADEVCQFVEFHSVRLLTLTKWTDTRNGDFRNMKRVLQGEKAMDTTLFISLKRYIRFYLALLFFPEEFPEVVYPSLSKDGMSFLEKHVKEDYKIGRRDRQKTLEFVPPKRRIVEEKKWRPGRLQQTAAVTVPSASVMSLMNSLGALHFNQ